LHPPAEHRKVAARRGTPDRIGRPKPTTPMKPWAGSCCTRAHSRMLTRWTGILLGLSITLGVFAQAGNEQVRTKADALFNEERYAEAMPLYSQLISLDPSDHELSFRYGTTLLFSGTEKDRAIGYLKYAVTAP